jgi:hypothetical protein
MSAGAFMVGTGSDVDILALEAYAELSEVIR